MAPAPRTNLGALLRAWRTKHDLDMRTAARMIGVSAATYLRMEHGTHDLSGAVLRRLLVWLWEPPRRRKETR